MKISDLPPDVLKRSRVQGYRRDWPPMDLPVFLSVPLKVKNPLNLREHWASRASRAKRERQIVTNALLVRYGNRRPKLPIVVTLDRRYARRERAMDTDGLAASFKAVRDAIAAWMGVDDCPDSGIEWKYHQEPNVQAMAVVDITIDTPAGGKETT